MENLNKDTENKDINPAEGDGHTKNTAEEKEKSPVENGAEAANGKEDEAGTEQKNDKGTEKKEAAKHGSKKGKGFIHSTKFKRTSVSTAFTVGFIAVIVLVNVIVGILGNKFPSMNVDMTQNGLNSLSTQSKKVVDNVKIPITINVLTSKQQAESDSSYHQISSLAAKMTERNSKISVKYVDIDKNPTFAANYKTEKLVAGDVLVESSKRYRLLTSSDLFTQQASQDYTSSPEMYSNVDSALASAINTVISDKLPLAAFDTAHTEDLDSTSYKALLQNNSFKADDFSLLTDSIPAGTQLVVLGCPTTDLTDSEVDKLDKFLSNKSLAADRSLLVACAPGQKDFPKLSVLLKEWGIAVQSGVVLESDSKKYWYNPQQNYSQVNLLADIQDTPDLGSGSRDYGNYFTMPLSESVNILFQNKVNKTTYPLVKSSDSCYLVTNETQSAENIKKNSYNLAALSQDIVAVGSKSYKSNVIVCGSTQMFGDGIINSSSFANGKYVTALSKYAVGTANSDNQVTIEPKNANVKDITLNANMTNFFGVWIFMLLIPLAVVVTGIVVYVRRKRL